MYQILYPNRRKNATPTLIVIVIKTVSFARRHVMAAKHRSTKILSGFLGLRDQVTHLPCKPHLYQLWVQTTEALHAAAAVRCLDPQLLGLMTAIGS
jgi:hypothetical protein